MIKFIEIEDIHYEEGEYYVNDIEVKKDHYYLYFLD